MCEIKWIVFCTFPRVEHWFWIVRGRSREDPMKDSLFGPMSKTMRGRRRAAPLPALLSSWARTSSNCSEVLRVPDEADNSKSS